MLLDYYDKLYSKSHQNYNYLDNIESDDFNYFKEKLIEIYNDNKK